jgi:hypothetical protein
LCRAPPMLNNTFDGVNANWKSWPSLELVWMRFQDLLQVCHHLWRECWVEIDLIFPSPSVVSASLGCLINVLF